MDTKVAAKTETEALFGNLNKPSLTALSYVLRHPEMWPAGFTWDYTYCESCAMGLAHRLWNVALPRMGDSRMGASLMAKAFGLGYTPAMRIFYGAGSRGHLKVEVVKTGLFGWGRPLVRRRIVTIGNGNVTPEMVADDIDRYLATVE